MFGPNLRKHFNEFRNYILNHQYEVGDGVILFPKANATAAGMYTHWVTGYESGIQHDHNVLPNEGLHHLLDATLKNSTRYATWYLMIHSGTGVPVAGTTAASYHGDLTEISTGYTEATRVTWAGDAVSLANTEVVNDATPAVFTINGTVAVNGAGLTTQAVKLNTGGILMSAGKFAATRNLSDTDEFNLKYKVDLDQV